jgi:hypothetical protein
MVSIDTLVSIGATSLSSLERFVGYVSGCYFPRTDTNVQLHPPRREVHPCIRERCQEKTIENELSRVVNAVGDSEPDQKRDRQVVDHGHDPTNHKLIHRKRRGEKQCHTLQSEKKIQATSTFTTKTMARANRLF